MIRQDESYTQKIKSAFKTVEQDGHDVLKVDYVALTIDIISVLGLTSGSSTNVSQILQQVIADIESEYAGLSWQAQTLEWGRLEHDVTGPLALATVYYNMNGNNGQAACPIPDINGCGIGSAAGDIAELRTDYSALIGRPYNAAAVAGTWQQFLATTRDSADGSVTTPMSAPQLPGRQWVFDWRVGLTALAQFVSEYTQIYAISDPNYLNDNNWDTGPGGLQDVRTLLEQLYTDMVSGVHADYMCQTTIGFGCGSFRRHESRYLTSLRWARPTSFNGKTVGGGATA
jgi:hypothetical protein